MWTIFRYIFTKHLNRKISNMFYSTIIFIRKSRLSRFLSKMKTFCLTCFITPSLHNILLNACSSSTVTPHLFALSILAPAASPATRYVRSLLTPCSSPPRSSTSFSKCLRDCDNLPVKQNDLPVNAPIFLT